MTRRLMLVGLGAFFGQGQVTLGPVLWSDCNPTPPRLLLTFAEYEAHAATLRATQTPANEVATDKAIAILRMAVGQEISASSESPLDYRSGRLVTGAPAAR